MAHIYVYSGAVGLGDGTTWANAYTTLKAAAEAAGTLPGDNIWVADDHAETTASALTITLKNTAGGPGTIICVNRGGSVPPVEADLRATATVTTTGASAMTLQSVANSYQYIYGIIFSIGSGAVNSALTLNQSNGWVFQNCKFLKLGTTGNTASFEFASIVKLINCTVQFGATGDSVSSSGSWEFEWLDTPSAIAGAIIPTTLFRFGGGGPKKVIHGVDFSAETGTLLPAGAAVDVYVRNCKLNAATTVAVAQNLQGARLFVANCDSGAINYRNEYYVWNGAQTTETTIVRTGGATDGVTPYAWKIVSVANARWLQPFGSIPITIWCDSTGAKTVNVYGYWANASAPNNDDIWFEAIYLGDAASTLSSTATSGKASFLATGTAIPTDASTWGGGATTTRFKMSCSLTAAQKGPITVTVKAAKASSTFYVDPKIEVV